MSLNASSDLVDFLKRNHIAVIASANKEGARPHAAVVFYATDSKMNLYFLTKKDTTKSRNIETNPQASAVIFEPELLRTAQIYGSISRVEDQSMMDKAKRIMAKYASQTAGTGITPISKLNAGEEILYRLTPQSIRLGDYKYGADNYIFDIATPAAESLE